VISNGHLLSLNDDVEKPISHLKLGDDPFLLLIQIHDRSEIEEETPQEGLTAVEVELLKHFDQLYDLLGMEEKLATEVRRPIDHFIIRSVSDWT
jgi:ubiquitin carboxyl-terminal hydrolase 34